MASKALRRARLLVGRELAPGVLDQPGGARGAERDEGVLVVDDRCAAAAEALAVAAGVRRARAGGIGDRAVLDELEVRGLEARVEVRVADVVVLRLELRRRRRVPLLARVQRTRGLSDGGARDVILLRRGGERDRILHE